MRLASAVRDDSVAQALCGIALGTQTALDLQTKDPPALAEPLRYVQRLADVAPAEMRALIFALRPKSLEKEGLVAALRKQASALGARHEIAVVDRLSDEPQISLQAKEALFRIAQEAMHNTAKHATRPRLRFHWSRRPARWCLRSPTTGSASTPLETLPVTLGSSRCANERVSSAATLPCRQSPAEAPGSLSSPL